MDKVYQEILAEVDAYYTGKVTEYGATPQGVDWNGAESQLTRFDQLVRILDPSTPCTMCDLGCGYGALAQYLKMHAPLCRYRGSDVSSAMIAEAQSAYRDDAKVKFEVGSTPSEMSDYLVASGLFNVRGSRGNEEWDAYIKTTIAIMDKWSTRGFAFNCLTKYSDADKIRNYLFYADPCALFDYCKTRYSRNVALLHDYGLYEFTILVRK